MNKSELIQAVAKEVGMTQQDVWRALNGTIVVTEKTVATGEKVQLTGFGTFEMRFRAGRSVRNPKTGESMFISEKKLPAFKPGKEFKALVEKPKKAWLKK